MAQKIDKGKEFAVALLQSFLNLWSLNSFQNWEFLRVSGDVIDISWLRFYPDVM